MGIHDRDYYRESTKGWSHFGDHATTNGLIVANIAFFLAQLMSQDGWVTTWGYFYLPAIEQGQLWRIFTAHFLHDPHGLMHIAFNMLVLYWVGYEVETIYGWRETLAFYLFCAFIISMGMIVLGETGLANRETPSLGASGPVTALFILFALHHPHQPITIFFILTVPARIAAVIYVAIDAFGLMGIGRSGIGYSAHLLGAGFAYLYFTWHLRILSFLPDLGRLRGSARGRVAPKLFVTPDEAPVGASQSRSQPAATQTGGFDEHLEARVDLVLEKVSRHGRESLTAEEREILQRASELYKRRRGS